MITPRATTATVLATLAAASLLHGQMREWTASGFDAQRTGWARADARLTRAAVTNGEFRFLWRMVFDNTNRQLNSLTEPVLLDRLIGYRGFKALAFFGGADDRVFAIDTDLARPYWTVNLVYSAATGGRPTSSPDCPGGLVATPSRRTTLAPAPAASPVAAGGGVRDGSAVGEPGRGAAVLSQPRPQRGGGAGRGAASTPPPRRSVAPIPFGGVDPVFAMGSDGFLHTLLASNGAEAGMPVPFIPPDARPSSLLWVDGIVYTTTSGGCGGAPNALWAIDLTLPPNERKTTTWKSGGAEIAGRSGLALGSDGTIYAALGTRSPRPSPSGTEPLADAVVALDRETLKMTSWFSAPGAGFNTTPVVIRHQDRDLVAVTADDGRLYLLDATSLGGSDRKTPLAVSEKFTAAGPVAGLATFEDGGTRWILAPSTDRIVAFKVVDEGGRLSLQRGWQSRLLTSPLAPIVVNGMVFAVSSGEYRGGPATLSAAARAKRSAPAVLYVLDGETGKPMWNSGTRITSFARAGLAAGGGQVYVVTYDNRLYAFGIPMEH